MRARGKWPLLWVALGASLWGTDTLFRRTLTPVLDSFQIVFFEHLILAIVLLPGAWRLRTRWRGLAWRQWAAVLGISWGGSALGTVCYTEAIRLGNPTTAVLLQKVQPLFAALLARLLLDERLGGRFWVCLILATGGAYLVSFGAAAPRAPIEISAALLALCAAALWGSSTVLGRFALRTLAFPALTTLRILLAVPVLALLALGRAPHALNARQAASLVLVALVPGLLALLVYYRGLGGTRASLAAIAELAFPATATLLNWLFFAARVTATQVAGFALIWSVILSLERRHAESAD